MWALILGFFYKIYFEGGGLWMGQLSVKSSIWRDIFVYDSDWGWSENTGSHTHTKITHKLLPHVNTPSPKRDLYLSKNVP